ncbi:MAG TPA: alkaline phosphatase family protein [Steroidobacteraceae bacterium]|nr:alkaline phosphatase family protein [Steroidobacteraceae bacterium]
MANQLGKIQHIVQVMLENRSLDHMLGYLYAASGNISPAGQPFDGLTGDESNPDGTGRSVAVYAIQADDPQPYLMPGADPGEGFLNTNSQLFSTDEPAAGTTPTNQGFVTNFKAAVASDLARHYSDTLPGTQPSQIMGMYTPELLPILSGLASGYAVCDRWFASVPTMTMPNRAFAAAATSQGHLDDTPKTYTCPTIFGRLSDKGLDWAIYGYDADPLTRATFPDTTAAADSHFGQFSDFQRRAAAGTLPVYTFLEPSWDASGNSQHPNYDVARGEQFLHDIYVALRGNAAAWNSTLLIITYDEHGGNYDHVAPPANATPPGDGTVGEHGFDFTRFGLRVPAVLVSPLIAAGTVFRGSGPIDHTSVLSTIAARWGTAPLTNRDRNAATLGDVLTLATPRTDDPLSGVLPPVSTVAPPNPSRPTRLDKVRAALVAALPVRNAHGHYPEDVTPPSFASASDLSDFVRDRTAAWKEHVRRRSRQQGAAGDPAGGHSVKAGAAAREHRSRRR